MKRSVLRASVALAGEAERRIRAAGHTPPAHADVIAAMAPAAAETCRAAKGLVRAQEYHAAAAERAEAAAQAAQAAVETLVGTWLAQAPAPRSRIVDLDPAVFRVELVHQDRAAAGEAPC
jgi:hypothetical protein